MVGLDEIAFRGILGAISVYFHGQTFWRDGGFFRSGIESVITLHRERFFWKKSRCGVRVFGGVSPFDMMKGMVFLRTSHGFDHKPPMFQTMWDVWNFFLSNLRKSKLGVLVPKYLKPIVGKKVQFDNNNWDEIFPLWLMKCFHNMLFAAACKGAEKVGI